jgi:hypothetical protein
VTAGALRPYGADRCWPRKRGNAPRVLRLFHLSLFTYHLSPSSSFLCVLAALREILAFTMRYLVKARVKPWRESALARAIDEKTLGRGSVAGDEYLWDMEHARITADHAVTWVEVCFCATPLAEERPYWEEYFELLSVKDAHARKNCRDLNGEEPWACTDCDCTQKLEEWLSIHGDPFLAKLDRE